jgi:hypothetical protein
MNGYYRGWIFYSEENRVKQQNVSIRGVFEGPSRKGIFGAKFEKSCFKEAVINAIIVAQ